MVVVSGVLKFSDFGFVVCALSCTEMELVAAGTELWKRAAEGVAKSYERYTILDKK